MKKNISILLSATLLFGTAALTANAATESSEVVSANEYRFEEISKTTLPNNTIKSYTYGIKESDNPETTAYFTQDGTTNIYGFKLTDCLKGTKTINNVKKGDYRASVCNGSNIYDRYNFEKTGGTYVLTKFKLSDFDDYFNSDGTCTNSYSDGYTHNFNFTKESDGNTSQLAIISGGYVNFVAPDKNGYVQAYICKNLGEYTYYMTNFKSANGWSGGGTTGSSIAMLRIGNSDLKLGISVDDVTAIQKYASDMKDFNKLQIRNADVNFDGKIDIDDATMIQKYIAGLL
ncbi:MAG: dockerin type I repeat-containing protein [Ruminococcus sp.]|nr:dockerin type I repeat-containing protein [Ruminococcus sp.]